MTAVSRLTTALLCRFGEITNRNFVLPLVFFSPTSRCNSRCLSCDWWRSSGEDDLTLSEVGDLARALPGLGTRLVVFTGGEPLVRADTFDMARLFRERELELWLLTSGVLLERYAAEVADRFDRVTISLDAADEALYRRVRGVDALATIETGVARLKALAPKMRITARATLHKLNYRELPAIVARTKALGLDGVSFLAADVSSAAFGRTGALPDSEPLLLDHDDIDEFRSVIDRAATDLPQDFASAFIQESPDKLRRLPRYYAAMRGEDRFPEVSCNAPWVSVVVEANGSVRPCFFHEPVGNLRDDPFTRIVSRALPAFRRDLDVSRNPVCRRCVCSLRAGISNSPW